MQTLDYPRMARLFGHRPPFELVAHLHDRGEPLVVDAQEVERAEWFWERRPKARVYRFLQRHALPALVVYTLALLPLVEALPLLGWLALYASLPVYLLREETLVGRWQRTYRRALWRVLCKTRVMGE